MIRNLRFAFVLPLAMAFALTSCDQKPKTAAKPVAEKKKAGPSVDARFEAARKMIAEGKFEEAAKSFHELGEEPNVRQPLANWISVLEGMSLLLDGREKESRKPFEALAARPPFSEKEEDTAMVKFFADISKKMSGDAAIPGDAVKDYDKWTFEGIAFLLFGLKDWNLEKLDDAVPLFRQFAFVAPERMVAWAEGPAQLKQLQEISDGCVSDFLEGRPALAELNSATSLEQQAAAVEKAKAARAKMKLTTKASKELDAKLAELGPKVATAMAEKTKMSDDELASDAKLLPEAKQKRLDFHAKYMFAEAKQAMLDPNLKTEPAKDEQQLLAKKSSWLANYKEQLIEDINKKGYRGPVNSKSGTPLALGVAKADPQQLMIVTAKGQVAVPWSEVAPESVFAMGKSFISDDLPPQILAFRKWHLGVFGSYAKSPESMALMKQAAEVRSLFAEEIPLFEKPSDPW